MNTLHLKYAVEVERCGSITQAAEKLYMNQPNLSKNIRELEDSLGIVIFKRTAKGMVPTKKGREFLSYAKNILTQVERMENLLGDDADRKISFNIAVPRASYVAHAFTEFAGALPTDREMHIDYRETNSLRTIRDVTDGEIDLGIIRFQDQYQTYFEDVLAEKRLRSELVLSFAYRLLLSQRHPLVQKETIEPAELDDCIEITHGDASTPSMPAPHNRIMGDDGKVLREISIYERGSQLELLDRVPGTYMWVSPMPRYVLDKFSLVQRTCAVPDNHHRDLLIYRRDYRLSVEDEMFMERLRATARACVSET